MDSAAPKTRSVVPARSESNGLGVMDVAGKRLASHTADRPDATTAFEQVVAPALEDPGSNILANDESASREQRASPPRDKDAAVVVLTGISTNPYYWYAWLVLLVLLLLIGWWSRRRSHARLPSAARVAPLDSDSTQAATPTSAHDQTNENGPAERADAKPEQVVAAGAERIPAPAVPLDRLTFAPVGVAHDETDREIALPKGERSAAAFASVVEPSDDSGRRDSETALNEAKRLLAAARPEDALRVLEATFDEAQAPQEAWIVAGWAWWRLAHEHEGPSAYAQANSAAECFELALQQEPSRTDLMTRVARSHLLAAQLTSTDALRMESLSKAMACFEQRSRARTDEPADHLELAQAALQRANASEQEGVQERGAWLVRAQQHLSAIPAEHALLQDEAAKAMAIDVQLGLAAVAKGEASARLYRNAIQQLRTALEDADAASADAWLAKMIDATRALIKHQSGGSRLLTLQSLKVEVSPRLQRTHAVAPLLAWINLLDEWARLLPTRAAQLKLVEADDLFERASRMNSQGPRGIQFARAYYLRSRSQHEQGANRKRTLQHASAILQRLPADALPESIVKTEMAEIHLALARLADGSVAVEHYGRAATSATQAAALSTRPIMAWHCAAQALLGLAELGALDGLQHAQMLGLADQLEAAGAEQPDALRTAARIRLNAGEFASSSRLCEAAWNAGASRIEVLPLWQEADARWARSLEHANQDAGWLRLHQRLRLASTSY